MKSRRYKCPTFASGSADFQPITRMPMAPLVVLVPISLLLWSASGATPLHALLIDLPGAQGAMAPDRSGKLTVEVTKDGAVILDGIQIHDSDFKIVMQRRVAEGNIGQLIYTPDPNVSYDRALFVLGHIARAGGRRNEICFGNARQHADFGFKVRPPSGSLTVLTSIWFDPAQALSNPVGRDFDSCEAAALLKYPE